MEEKISDPKVKECFDLVKQAKTLYYKLNETQREIVDFLMEGLGAEEVDITKE